MENLGQATAVGDSQLNRPTKTLLEWGFGRLWVEGKYSTTAGLLFPGIRSWSRELAAPISGWRLCPDLTAPFKAPDIDESCGDPHYRTWRTGPLVWNDRIS